jgi:hypothetical protein
LVRIGSPSSSISSRRACSARRWLADFKRVAAKRDAAAERYRRYPELIAQLIEIFQQAASVDQEVAASPPVAGQYPLNVSRVACPWPATIQPRHALDQQVLHAAVPGAVKQAGLATEAYHRSRTVRASAYDARYSADWAQARDERAQAVREEQERVARFYEDKDRRREEREAAEAQARRSRADGTHRSLTAGGRPPTALVAGRTEGTLL